jgi:hypothetical protein
MSRIDEFSLAEFGRALWGKEQAAAGNRRGGL